MRWRRKSAMRAADWRGGSPEVVAELVELLLDDAEPFAAVMAAAAAGIAGQH